MENNPFFCPDAGKVAELETLMDDLRKSGNSIGARVNLVASDVPVGLGEPIFDRLDADIAKALMSINAVKGVEIGAGFDAVEQRGTEHRDEITAGGFLSNHAGGTLGGISSGQDILASIALKPTSSIRIPGKTVDIHGNETEIATTGRHDPCVGIRATPIAEAMLAIVLDGPRLEAARAEPWLNDSQGTDPGYTICRGMIKSHVLSGGPSPVLHAIRPVPRM